jgi:Fe-S-cluster containining protein
MNPREIFEAFYDLARGLLHMARPGDEYAAVLREVHQQAAAMSGRIVEARDLKLACREGCYFCCHVKVDAHAPEILYAADYLRRTLSAAQIQEIVARSRAHAQKIAPMTVQQQMTTNNRCPLLVEGRCIAYEARPLACRRHHAMDVKLCERIYDTADSTLPGSHDEELRLYGGIYWMAARKAFLEAGYDPETYDLGSAIGEALANPASARRWRDGKRAFPNSARVKDPERAAAADRKLLTLT